MPGPVARLFDEMAGSYDELEPWYEHLYRTMHAILRAELALPAVGARAARRPRALDAGCGTGLQSQVLGELGYAVHGVDIAGALLVVARRKLPSAGLALADITALPHPDGAFDAVSCCGSTLSFVEAPLLAVRELARVLRPGGRLLLECEHKWSLDLAWAALDGVTGGRLGYGVSPREVARQLARPPGEGFWLDYPVARPDGSAASMRLRLFTMTELRTMLRASGLVPVRAWGIHGVTNLIPSTVLHRERLAPPVARLFALLARIDGAVAGLAPARWLANSLVISARREAQA
jgi:SAM-dependent methyltransferase